MLITRLWPLGVTQIACGDSHSCALAHDGRIFCWGRGKYGQIGQGSFDNATLPHHVRVAFPGQQVWFSHARAECCSLHDDCHKAGCTCQSMQQEALLLLMPNELHVTLVYRWLAVAITL